LNRSKLARLSPSVRAEWRYAPRTVLPPRPIDGSRPTSTTSRPRGSPHTASKRAQRSAKAAGRRSRTGFTRLKWAGGTAGRLERP
jgi:hypothetical protein